MFSEAMLPLITLIFRHLVAQYLWATVRRQQTRVLVEADDCFFERLLCGKQSFQ